MAHLGFAHEGQPFVIPTLHARLGDDVYVHGSSASRTLRALGGALPVCLTVTLLDGLVFARSVFEMSANYRSVVVLGTRARRHRSRREAARRCEAFSEQVMPGRWAEARGPTRQEVKATSILALPLDEASAKISDGRAGRRRDATTPRCRSGPGTCPLRLVAGEPVPCPHLRARHPRAGGDRRLPALTRHHGGDEDRHPLRQERHRPRQAGAVVATMRTSASRSRRPRRIASPPPAACRLRTHCARDP